ncbi:MAG TPA: NAD(P)/FAD-dependent oxidoreductase [Solirubrobacterales bacterium]|jgi:2-polyprenyl-6-methoxyphenol hydroxylase-like FAD-dependent oxidoreductase|nr:NAD(P)/FAD-dependent oxidoreductase [Solirubrobacterales bacterium]
MAGSERDGKGGTRSYDAVIVGGSLAGCATAMMLGRAGARVAVVEKRPDPAAFKRICSHFIQASAVPSLERLDLLEPMVEAGAVRSRFRMRTPWGWIDTPPERAAMAVNLRREKLDPLVRGQTAATPGVEMLIGLTVTELRRVGGTISGIVARDREGEETVVEAPLTIGADGRDSTIAELSRVESKTSPHGRIAYGGYFEGIALPHAPDASVWMMDPDWAAAFPTDDGLTFFAAMVGKDRAPEFKADAHEALVRHFDSLPEAPSLRGAKAVEDPGVVGKVDMTNRVRGPIAPGLALVGDAALAIDPLYGVGCGWAFQSAEWLGDAVAPALRGEEALEAGLSRYRREHRKHLRGHTTMMLDAATGRKMNAGERLLFSGAARDPRVARIFDAFGARQIGPARMMATGMPLAAAANARYALGGRRRGDAGRVGANLGSAA